MELTGEPFAQTILILLMLTLFAGNLIQDLELSAGQLLKTYHMSDRLIFRMATKNQFTWMMWTNVLTLKTLLLLAPDLKIIQQVETTDWQIQKTLLRDQEPSKEFGVDWNISAKIRVISGDKLVISDLL